MDPRPSPSRPPTLRDVAGIAGVSIKTVSNVVHDHPHVRAETRERVRAAILRLGYRPQMAARHLRTGESGIITLALPSLRFSFFSEITQALIDEAQRRGRTVLLHSTSSGVEAERTVLGGFDQLLGDGVVFTPQHLTDAEYAALGRVHQPTVFLGEHLPEVLPAGSDHVTTDNEAAAHAATVHLLASGRRRLAFLGQVPAERRARRDGTGTLRRDGFLRALAEHGLDPATAHVQTVDEWLRADGAAGGEALLRAVPEVDGIVCANDDLAIGLLARLRASGRRVPEDVAVIGYDDAMDAAFTSPPLTSISPGKEALASTALDLLAERIGGYDGPPRRRFSPYGLVVRGSTLAPVPSSPRPPEEPAA